MPAEKKVAKKKVATKKEEPSLEQRFITLMGFGHLPLGDFFSFLVKVPTREEKAEYIRRFCESRKERKDTVRGLVEIMYHPAAKLALPPGAPPYENKNDPTNSPSSIYKAVRNLVYFIPRQRAFIENQIKRETTFIRILESMPADEARILVEAKDGHLKSYMGLDEATFRMAYPKWLPPKAEEEGKPQSSGE